MNSPARTTPLLVVIVGPTGSGKTALSLQLAERLDAPVLSTDSRQIYRGMAIGTAQPTADELARAEHHFIAERDIDEEFSCGTFEREALARLAQLFAHHDTVLAVGGSGLYVRALCEGMDALPDADPALRAELTERLAREGLGPLVEELRQLDPVYCSEVDRSNPARVVRALEVCRTAGRPYSALRTGTRRPRPFRILKLGLDLPRAELYARIDRRVDLMMAAGLESEARALYPHRRLNSLQTVGYKELFAWFDGTCTRDEAVALIKRNSRRYAKRQLTWFRRDPEIHWFSPEQTEAMIRLISFGES